MLGRPDGNGEGNGDGGLEGWSDGIDVGEIDGIMLGRPDGNGEGNGDGGLEGWSVGSEVGDGVGTTGALVGAGVGTTGAFVGSGVGYGVGEPVGELGQFLHVFGHFVATVSPLFVANISLHLFQVSKRSAHSQLLPGCLPITSNLSNVS